MPKSNPNPTKGQGTTEYALILSLVALVVIVILMIVGPTIGNVFSNILYQMGDPNPNGSTYVVDAGGAGGYSPEQYGSGGGSTGDGGGSTGDGGGSTGDDGGSTGDDGGSTGDDGGSTGDDGGSTGDDGGSTGDGGGSTGDGGTITGGGGGTGSVTDPNDTDGDSVPNDSDNCPDDINAGQSDYDGDNRGDVCDTEYHINFGSPEPGYNNETADYSKYQPVSMDGHTWIVGKDLTTDASEIQNKSDGTCSKRNILIWNGSDWQSSWEDGGTYPVCSGFLLGNDSPSKVTWQSPTLPSGTYLVRLHFVDSSTGSYERIMDVAVEGTTWKTGFSALNTTGQTWESVILEREVSVSDGHLNLVLDGHPNSRKAAIAGIEIIEATGSDDSGGGAEPQDSDNDGVLDASDQCPGHDDNIDVDKDGTPDGCDSFTVAPYVAYAFEDSGSTVTDRMSGMNLSLTSGSDNSGYSWTGNALVITSQNVSFGTSGATLTGAIQSSEAITISAWIKPANTSQSGPGRIVTLSWDGNKRNFTLGQNGGKWQVRFRRDANDDNGMERMVEQSGVSTQATHVVFTYAYGTGTLYINGAAAQSRSDYGNINFDHWDSSYWFGIGHERGNNSNRHFMGTYYDLQIFTQALTADEVGTLYTETNPNG